MSEHDLAERAHGAVRDPAHAEYFTTAHRNLADPVDALDQPERRLVVDDYTTQVRGAGSHTLAPSGGTDPGPGALDDLPDAQPG